ncbi:hypothetical protein CHUAL_006257 [Chamberlinius hualienensis]
MRLMVILMLGVLVRQGNCWGSKHEKVKLKDVSVLTLYADRMTSGRRSSPVSQLKCVGGSAGCHAFRPQVVQCYNRGSDGQDIQWECKTDMDNAYRFGKIEVSCEGYDYSDDEYILKGSCGLEYTLDFSKEGHEQQQHHNYYGENNYQQQHHQGSSNPKSKSGSTADILVLLAVVVVIYFIYKTCIGGSGSDGSRSDDHQGGPNRPSWYSGFFGGGGGGGYPPSAPPPPPYGFRSDYTSQSDSCSGAADGTRRQSGAGGGFWTGAGLGGMLGYMLGNRGNTGGYGQRHNYNTYESFGGTRGTEYVRSRSSNSSSSGTRTASGFGGTSRR